MHLSTGLIDQNQNTTAGMIEIMTDLLKYCDLNEVFSVIYYIIFFAFSNDR